MYRVESLKGSRDGNFKGKFELDRSELMRFMCEDLYFFDKVGGRDVEIKFLILY